MKRNKSSLALAMASALLLAGCGGDDSHQSDPTGAETVVGYRVKAIDGYLQDAKVWLDITPDWVHDPAHEPSAMTISGGVAVLDVTGIADYGQYPLMVEAVAGKTVDSDTPEQPIERSFILSAPARQSDITPLTTLVRLTLVQAAASNLAMTEEEARDYVARLVGLSSEQVYGDYVARAREQGSEPDASPVVYAARNIVASQLLSLSGDELLAAVSEDKSVSSFDDKIAVVGGKIKHKVSAMQLSEPVFSGSEDISVDSDNDTYPDIYDAFPEDGSRWLEEDVDGNGNSPDEIAACREGDSMFDSSGALLSPPVSYGDFLVAAEHCRKINGEQVWDFTDEMVRGTRWGVYFAVFDATEYWIFRDDEQQRAETAEGDLMGLWSVKEGRLYVNDGEGDSVLMVITHSNGKQFAFKDWWRSEEYGFADTGSVELDKGAIESGIMWREE